MIAALHYKPTAFNDSYSPTAPYFLSTYYFVISSKMEPYDPFVKLMFPFKGEIWLILVLVLVGGNALVYIITHVDHQLKYFVLGRTHQGHVYNMVIVSLGGPVSRDPVVPFSRFLLMVWLVATFILRTVYQGLMFHFIRHDIHMAPPKTFQDLQDSGYTILMSEVNYNYVKDLRQLHENAVVLNETELENFHMLRHLEDYEFGKVAILSAHEYFGHYKMLEQDVSDFYIVPETLFTQRLSIYMKKNSMFLNRFNMYISSFINEGLMNRWERFMIYSNPPSSQGDAAPKPMDLYQLYGALNLLALCLGISSCVFVIELVIFQLWSSIRRRRRCDRKCNKRVTEELISR